MSIAHASIQSASRGPASRASPPPLTPVLTIPASTPTRSQAAKASPPRPVSTARGRARKSGAAVESRLGGSKSDHTSSTFTADGQTSERSARATHLKLVSQQEVDRLATIAAQQEEHIDLDQGETIMTSARSGAGISAKAGQGGSSSAPANGTDEAVQSRSNSDAAQAGRSEDSSALSDEEEGSDERSESSEEDADVDEDDASSSDGESTPSRLLNLALATLRAKEARAKAEAEAEKIKVAEEKARGGGEFAEDLMLLESAADAEERTRRKERPIPGLQIPSLPAHPLKLHLAGPEPTKAQAKKSLASTSSAASNTARVKNPRKKRADVPAGATGSSNGLGGMLGGMAKAHGVQAEGRGGSEGGSKSRALEMDMGEYEKQLTRREKAKMPRTQSTAAEWASLPTIPSSLLPQMKRDYQALNLGNSLDPKRFMKGGRSKEASGKVPESFGIGVMINPPRHLQSTTLPRERAYVPGSIVSALVGEQEQSGYAKRKFGELQEKKMANGRGNGWKKRRVG